VDLQDTQARYIEAAVNGVVIACIYLPNGNPQPGPKFSYKLTWFESLICHTEELIASNLPVILAGDFNVVPTTQDIYPTRSLENNALIQPESRGAFAVYLPKAGPMLCGNCIHTDRSGPSGITSGSDGRLTRACDLIIFCSRQGCQKS
jgi:exonuclease III